MRDSFHEDLDKISEHLVEMTRLAGSAMSRATTALLDGDLHLAESVIAADEQIDALRRETDERSIDLLARQQPVATDLRRVVTAMRMRPPCSCASTNPCSSSRRSRKSGAPSCLLYTSP